MDTGKKMDMEQFVESIKERLEQEGRFEKVGLQNVRKNNGVMRHGLLLHDGGSNLVPTIYLEPFFEAYRDGEEMEEIVGRMLDVYESAPCERVDVSFFQEFSTVKDRLCMKLVNRKANAGLLEGVPYREFLDMAVVYYVDYYNLKIGVGTIQVCNSHMKKWGVTEKDLWEAAGVNLPERKPGRIEDMDNILTAMILGLETGDVARYNCDMEKNPLPMMVITNTERRYGAAVVLYGGMLKQVADKIGGDLFILPSSVHEVIAVPVNGDEEAEVAKFKRMVMEVNRSELEPEEMLSDNVYIYRREQDRLEMA